ncbi:hypothetical protein ACOSP7_027245 [Xanthoceras sorbifolium]
MTLSCLSELARLISVSWWSWWWDVLIEVRNTRLIPTLLATTLVLAISFYAWSIKNPFSSFPPLPPGPPGLPLLGNLLFLHSSTWSSNGPEWRKLRKIFIQELMNKTSLDACHALRPQEIREMVKDLYAKVGSPINIGDQMFLTLLNVIMSMSWGGGGGGGGGGVGIQFRQMVGEFIELWGAPNISDLFPVLARFDLQGVESKMKKLSLWFDKFFESLIDSSKDFLETLLELTQQGDDKSSLIIHEPSQGIASEKPVKNWRKWSALTILWKNFISQTCIILIPRSPHTTQTVSKYTIPKGSRVLFNVWAMQRDPVAWESPLEFQPERFLRDDDGKCEYKGNNFNLLPFGSGRRMCAGIPMAENDPSCIGYLKFGFTMTKQEPLIVIPAVKLSSPKCYY